MPVSPWYKFGTFSSDSANSGSVAWTTPANAEDPDATYTTAAVTAATASPLSEYLKCLDVNGIDTTNWDTISEVRIQIRAKITDAGSIINWSDVKQVFGGTIQTEDASGDVATDLTTSDRDDDFVFSSDIPTTAQVAASDYGVVIELDGAPAVGGDTLSIDSVSVQFVYTRASIPTTRIRGDLSYRIHAMLDTGEDKQEWDGSEISIKQLNSASSFVVADELGGPLDIGAGNTVGKIFAKNVTPEFDNNSDNFPIWLGPYVNGAQIKFVKLLRGEECVFQPDPDAALWAASDYGEATLKYWVVEK